MDRKRKKGSLPTALQEYISDLDPQPFAGTDHVGGVVDMGIPVADASPVRDAITLGNPDQGIIGGHLVLNPAGTVRALGKRDFATADFFQIVFAQLFEVILQFVFHSVFLLVVWWNH